MGVFKYDETYIGNTYNFLTVSGYAYDKYGNRCFKCKCVCENEVLGTPKYVINGVVKSCGCKQKELQREASVIHGGCSYGKPERLYVVYRGMLERCYNPNHPHYADWGGRGITVCDEWRNDYLAFKAWAISAGYDEKKSKKEQSIDRENNDGNYEPSNCRWATAKEQCANRRPHKPHKIHKKNAMITVNGIKRPKRDVCAEYGISVETFDYRVKHKGMSVIEALTAPKMAIGRPSAVS